MPTLENSRHERFAQALASGKPADSAYREAGFRPNSGNCIRLKGNERVKARILEIQSAGAKEAEISIARIVSELLMTYEQSKAARQFGPAVRALELIGRTVGAFVDRVLVADHSSASDEDLIRTIAGDDPLFSAHVRKLLGRNRFDPAIGS